ncbi:MAG: WD40 repeat domain-containing protein, partial [bacterium]
GSYQIQRNQTARRIEIERWQNEWHQQYANTIVAAGKYFHSNNQRELQFALNSIKQAPDYTGMKNDPREFAWRYFNEMSRPVSSVVAGLPANVAHYVMVPSEATKSLWAGGTDGFVREIDTETNGVLREMKLQEKPVESIDISPDGKWLAIGNDSGEIRLYNRSDLTLVTLKTLHEGEVADLKFSRDSQKLISTGRDGQLHVWRINEDQVKPLLKKFKSGSTKFSSLYGMALLPDPDLVAVGTATGEILVVNIEKVAVVRVLRGHHDDVTAVVLSTSWKWLVSAGLDNSLCIWDLEKNILVNRINLAESEQMNIVQRDFGRKIPWISQVAHIESLSSVAFDPGNGVISLYHVPTGIKMGELRGNNLPAWSLVYLPWNKRLATFSRDLQLRVWNEPFTRNITGHFFHFDLAPPGQSDQAPFLLLDPSQKLASVGPQLKMNSSLSPVDYYVSDSAWANSNRDYLTLVMDPPKKIQDPASHRIEFMKPIPSPESGQLQFHNETIVLWNYKTSERISEPKISANPEKPLATLISTDRKLHFIDYSTPENP